MTKLIVPICNRTNYTKLKTVLCEFTTVQPLISLSSSIISDKYGNAYTDIIKDGYNIASRIDCLFMNDSTGNMARTCGLSMIEHASLYERTKVDGVLIVGDRFDMLPSLITAKMMNIPIFHIQGGEQSGSIDDTIRNIMSLCATYHYTSTQQSTERVVKLTGSKNVIYSGCPAVEYIQKLDTGDYLDVSNLKTTKHGIPIEPHEEYYLVIVHPDTTHNSEIDVYKLLSTLVETGRKIITFYPNVDAYNDTIVNNIREMKNDIIVIKHMPVNDFAQLMAHAKMVIGNSSSIIRETATLGVPAINIGNRQKCRERNKNTVDIPASLVGLEEAILQTRVCATDNIYFKPNSGLTIARHIEEIFKVGKT